MNPDLDGYGYACAVCGGEDKHRDGCIASPSHNNDNVVHCRHEDDHASSPCRVDVAAHGRERLSAPPRTRGRD